jgi:hypothetical protein
MGITLVASFSPLPLPREGDPLLWRKIEERRVVNFLLGMDNVRYLNLSDL